MKKPADPVEDTTVGNQPGHHRKNKVALVIGVFDLFHRGHLELLRRAMSFGDKLIVVVNGDEFTSGYKRRPIFSEEDRLEIVKSIKGVDVAVLSNSPDAKPVIERYGVNVIIHGDDWDHDSYLKQICVEDAYLETNGIEMHYTPYYEGVSTSSIISAIMDR